MLSYVTTNCIHAIKLLELLKLLKPADASAE